MIERINPFQHGAFGYYSQGVKIDLGPKTMVLVAGQIALDDNGRPAAPGDFAAQTRFVFQRIEQVLAASGATINDVVQARIYVTDVTRYDEVSAVRNEYFATARPASVMVEISHTVSEGCDVEIEVMAIIDNA